MNKVIAVEIWYGPEGEIHYEVKDKVTLDHFKPDLWQSYHKLEGRTVTVIMFSYHDRVSRQDAITAALCAVQNRAAKVWEINLAKYDK